jgi:hypothetical protein
VTGCVNTWPRAGCMIKDGGGAGMKRCVGEEETCIYWQRLYPAEEKQYQREREAPHVSQEPGASQRPLAAQE